MTCAQLGGACEKTFTAETFEDMGELSKAHGMQMFQEQDEAHMKAMQTMQEMMQDPDAMQTWMDEKRKLFDSLPEDE